LSYIACKQVKYEVNGGLPVKSSQIKQFTACLINRL
jgi:hypothetical protein